MSERASEIRIKRAYAAPAEADGARVLVDRLWPRGLKRESAALTLWLKEVAPSPALRTWFGHDPARWTEFRRRYRAELAHDEAELARLAEFARRGPLTLVYGARDVDHNQAVVLAEVLRERLDAEDRRHST